ncbi:Acyltransferase 3 [Mycena sanguinolenta]|uniref:Acyltransferase 3 n=1 Tax=Mycena sanguinolenta TaxID=230812 RepID=A0A8H6ZEJ2_9AGAR|nr:Acyltransferase 3 [Mycena sanguinolenta]
MSGDPEGELAALLPRLIRDSRIHYIDNLRSTLIALVIFHHACLPFAGIGMWYYTSPHHPSMSSPVLIAFVAVNQSYFMGLLFFLGGHWSSYAADRKPWNTFCVDKLKRLGIPAVVYTLFVEPLVGYIGREHDKPIFSALFTYWASLRGVRGPVWFIAVLLFFDLIYITVRTCLPSLSLLVPKSAAQYRAAAVVGISTVIVSSYFIRKSHPAGVVTPPLGIQLAYATQYVLAYISGTCLSRIQQYLLVSSHPGRALALAYLFAFISLGLISIPAKFGMTWLFEVLYAIWNELCFYFIGTALYSFFHDWSHTTKRWGNTARHSYGAYLLHALVVVCLQILVDVGRPGLVYGLIKTLVVGTLGVGISWAAAWVLIRVPGVGDIL